MLEKLRRLFGRRTPEKSLSERLFANILMPQDRKDYFRWPYLKR